MTKSRKDGKSPRSSLSFHMVTGLNICLSLVQYLHTVVFHILSRVCSQYGGKLVFWELPSHCQKNYVFDFGSATYYVADVLYLVSLPIKWEKCLAY